MVAVTRAQDIPLTRQTAYATSAGEDFSLSADQESIFPTRNQIAEETKEILLDENWAKSSFLIGDKYFVDNADIKNRYWSSARIKFTDSRLGCNLGINAKPQFTRYADVRDKGRRPIFNEVSTTTTTGPFGMGRYYSEAIDDPSQTIYMRFGVPQFNSLLGFIRQAFDSDMAGVGKSAAFRTGAVVGGVVGSIVSGFAFPALTLVMAGVKFFNWAFSRPTSKFYNMKPSMLLYWSAVSSLVSNIAINRGLFPKVVNEKFGSKDPAEQQYLNQPYIIDKEQLSALSAMMPDIFTDQNIFDIYALATRAQRNANKIFTDEYDKLTKNSLTDFESYLKRELTGTGTHTTYLTNNEGQVTFGNALNRLLKSIYYAREDKDYNANATEIDPRVTPEGQKREDSWFEKYREYFLSEFDDGAEFALFKVEHTGSVQESFSNSVGESELSSKINGTVSQMREARFTFADGNFLGDTVKSVTDAVAGFATNALDKITFGISDFAKALSGAGYIDIPKHWQNSSASLPKASYKMKLISPYGNMISQLQNIYIPLSMIMAGAMPISTGKQSYSSPFLCQIFDRGRCQVKLGMIDSLSITRGTSHLAFNTKGNALAIDVSFSVVDLSSIMHMPIDSGGLFSFSSSIDEDNILMDYLAVLAGQDINSQIYAIPKAQIKIAKQVSSALKVTSPAWWASQTHDSITSGFLSTVTLGLAPLILEGASRGSAVGTGPILGQ